MEKSIHINVRWEIYLQVNLSLSTTSSKNISLEKSITINRDKKSISWKIYIINIGWEISLRKYIPVDTGEKSISQKIYLYQQRVINLSLGNSIPINNGWKIYLSANLSLSTVGEKFISREIYPNQQRVRNLSLGKLSL